LLCVSILASVVTGVILIIRSYIDATNAGDGCSSWPIRSQAAIPFLDEARLQHIHWLHRITVLF
jgi:heme A synthase